MRRTHKTPLPIPWRPRLPLLCRISYILLLLLLLLSTLPPPPPSDAVVARASRWRFYYSVRSRASGGSDRRARTRFAPHPPSRARIPLGEVPNSRVCMCESVRRSSPFVHWALPPDEQGCRCWVMYSRTFHSVRVTRTSTPRVWHSIVLRQQQAWFALHFQNAIIDVCMTVWIVLGSSSCVQSQFSGAFEARRFKFPSLSQRVKYEVPNYTTTNIISISNLIKCIPLDYVLRYINILKLAGVNFCN